MPDMSGDELAGSLKTGPGHDCPRLSAISGRIEDAEVHNRLFDRMVKKPIDLRKHQRCPRNVSLTFRNKQTREQGIDACPAVETRARWIPVKAGVSGR